LLLDRAATAQARQAERDARKKRGKPFKQFVKQWSTKEPPANLPYYGCWGEDRSVIFAGSPDNRMNAGAIQPIFMPNPKDVRIAELERRVKELEQGAAKGRA